MCPTTQTMNTFVLADIVKTFIELRFLLSSPRFKIDDNADFKSFIRGYAEELVG